MNPHPETEKTVDQGAGDGQGAGQPAPEAAPGASAQVDLKPINLLIQTSNTHRLLTLSGLSFVFFEIFFLFFYASDCWHNLDIQFWGIPAVVLSILMAHLFLLACERPQAAKLFACLWHGKPPIIYRQWLVFQPNSFNFGLRRISLSAVDGVTLTFFGNLLIKSRALCGRDALSAPVVLKVPSAPVSLSGLKEFVARIKAVNPQLELDKRLMARLTTQEKKSVEIVSLLSPIVMFVVLLDVGNVTFPYLEMMKDYYLAEKLAHQGELLKAKTYLQKGDYLNSHRCQVSFVNSKLLSRGSVAAGIESARSQAFWYLGQKEGALAAARRAVELTPDSYRLNLRLARLLAETGNISEAHKHVALAIDRRAEMLLPRLYEISLLLGEGNLAAARRFYKISASDLSDQVFGDEPVWPPGGNKFLDEMIYSDDMYFILDRFIPAAAGNLPKTRSEDQEGAVHSGPVRKNADH